MISMSVGEMSPQEIHEYNGVMVRTLKNGVLQRVDNGRLMTGPKEPPFADPLLAQNASYQRWHGAAQDAYRRKVQEGLAQRGDSTLTETIEQARGEMIGILVEEVVLNPDVRGIDRIKAHEHALEQSGMDARAPKQAQQPPGGVSLTLSADADTAQKLIEALLAVRDRGNG